MTSFTTIRTYQCQKSKVDKENVTPQRSGCGRGRGHGRGCGQGRGKTSIGRGGGTNTHDRGRDGANQGRGGQGTQSSGMYMYMYVCELLHACMHAANQYPQQTSVGLSTLQQLLPSTCNSAAIPPYMPCHQQSHLPFSRVH